MRSNLLFLFILSVLLMAQTNVLREKLALMGFKIGKIIKMKAGEYSVEITGYNNQRDYTLNKRFTNFYLKVKVKNNLIYINKAELGKCLVFIDKNRIPPGVIVEEKLDVESALLSALEELVSEMEKDLAEAKELLSQIRENRKKITRYIRKLREASKKGKGNKYAKEIPRPSRRKSPAQTKPKTKFGKMASPASISPNCRAIISLVQSYISKINREKRRLEQLLLRSNYILKEAKQGVINKNKEKEMEEIEKEAMESLNRIKSYSALLSKLTNTYKTKGC